MTYTFLYLCSTYLLLIVSDHYGRRPVVLLCLAFSAIQYFVASYTKTLIQLSLARIISAIFGGLVPIMQSCVADVTSESDRPKYLGRITASFGLGFVLGKCIYHTHVYYVS